MENAVSTGTRTTGTRTTAISSEAGRLALGAGVSHRAITERILELAHKSGFKAALIDAPQGTVTAWPRFGRIVRAAADGLSRRGLADGDSAGVFVQDAASFALTLNAIRAAGAVPCAIRPDATMAEVAERLNACGARVLITASPLAEVAAEAADRSRVRQVFSFGDAPGTTSFRSLLGVAKHGGVRHGDAGDADGRRADLDRGPGSHGAGSHGAGSHEASSHEASSHEASSHEASSHEAGFALSHRDVVVAGPPCGEGQAYTSLLDLTLLTGGTIVAAPVPLITAAMRAYKGTAAIVPRGTDVPGLPADRVFGVA